MELASTFEAINWIGILVAAVSAFAVGGIWYGPLFAKAWMDENGFTEEDLAKRNMGKVFGVSFLLTLIMSINLAMFIGPEADVAFGAAAGFFTGAFWIAAMLGVYYLFEARSFKLWAINGGYGVVALTLMGVIIGALN